MVTAIDDKGNNVSNLHNDTYHENLPKLNTKNYKGILMRAVYVLMLLSAMAGLYFIVRAVRAWRKSCSQGGSMARNRKIN
jgi:hypothetical protein